MSKIKNLTIICQTKKPKSANSKVKILQFLPLIVEYFCVLIDFEAIWIYYLGLLEVMLGITYELRTFVDIVKSAYQRKNNYDLFGWGALLFSDRAWTIISTRGLHLMDLLTILWMAWAHWQTISRTFPCLLRHGSPAKGRHPTTYATFVSTKDTTSKTALRWDTVTLYIKQLHNMWLIWAVYQTHVKCCINNTFVK